MKKTATPAEQAQQEAARLVCQFAAQDADDVQPVTPGAGVAFEIAYWAGYNARKLGNYHEAARFYQEAVRVATEEETGDDPAPSSAIPAGALYEVWYHTDDNYLHYVNNGDEGQEVAGAVHPFGTIRRTTRGEAVAIAEAISRVPGVAQAAAIQAQYAGEVIAFGAGHANGAHFISRPSNAPRDPHPGTERPAGALDPQTLSTPRDLYAVALQNRPGDSSRADLYLNITNERTKYFDNAARFICQEDAARVADQCEGARGIVRITERAGACPIISDIFNSDIWETPAALRAKYEPAKAEYQAARKAQQHTLNAYTLGTCTRYMKEAARLFKDAGALLDQTTNPQHLTAAQYMYSLALDSIRTARRGLVPSSDNHNDQYEYCHRCETHAPAHIFSSGTDFCDVCIKAIQAQQTADSLPRLKAEAEAARVLYEQAPRAGVAPLQLAKAQSWAERAARYLQNGENWEANAAEAQAAGVQTLGSWAENAASDYNGAARNWAEALYQLGTDPDHGAGVFSDEEAPSDPAAIQAQEEAARAEDLTNQAARLVNEILPHAGSTRDVQAIARALVQFDEDRAASIHTLTRKLYQGAGAFVVSREMKEQTEKARAFISAGSVQSSAEDAETAAARVLSLQALRLVHQEEEAQEEAQRRRNVQQCEREAARRQLIQEDAGAVQSSEDQAQEEDDKAVRQFIQDIQHSTPAEIAAQIITLGTRAEAWKVCAVQAEEAARWAAGLSEEAEAARRAALQAEAKDSNHRAARWAHRTRLFSAAYEAIKEAHRKANKYGEVAGVLPRATHPNPYVRGDQGQPAYYAALMGIMTPKDAREAVYWAHPSTPGPELLTEEEQAARNAEYFCLQCEAIQEDAETEEEAQSWEPAADQAPASSADPSEPGNDEDGAYQYRNDQEAERWADQDAGAILPPAPIIDSGPVLRFSAGEFIPSGPAAAQAPAPSASGVAASCQSIEAQYASDPQRWALVPNEESSSHQAPALRLVLLDNIEAPQPITGRVLTAEEAAPLRLVLLDNPAEATNGLYIRIAAVHVDNLRACYPTGSAGVYIQAPEAGPLDLIAAEPNPSQPAPSCDPAPALTRGPGSAGALLFSQ